MKHEKDTYTRANSDESEAENDNSDGVYDSDSGSVDEALINEKEIEEELNWLLTPPGDVTDSDDCDSNGDFDRDNDSD